MNMGKMWRMRRTRRRWAFGKSMFGGLLLSPKELIVLPWGHRMEGEEGDDDEEDIGRT
jgi:hypothetical protein